MASNDKNLVLLTFVFEKEGELWTACCEELGTATFAETLEQAKTEIVEMVTLHLNALEEVGERDRFFSEHGIKVHKPGRKHATLSIPIELFPDRHSRFYEPYTFTLSPV